MSDERGPCYGLEGVKHHVTWFRGYLVVVSSDQTGTTATHIHIHDLKNKFVAFTGTFSDIKCVLCEFGSIFIVTGDNKMYQLKEKDTQTKLETLFKKNLFSIAINLATSQQFDPNIVIDIYRKYGDHLYSKGDYDAAVDQYVKTIERLEPSYIIRKFLDAQRTLNLTQYLEALHAKGLATKDHTTLLLNCYTKLKDVAMLEKFVNDPNLIFDTNTAISVLRQAGYSDHALSLARRNKEHSQVIRILLEDKQDPVLAVEHVWTLAFDAALEEMNRHGRVLVCGSADRATALLMELCTNYAPRISGPASSATVAPRESVESRLSSALSHLMNAVTRDQPIMSLHHSSDSSPAPASAPSPFIVPTTTLGLTPIITPSSFDKQDDAAGSTKTKKKAKAEDFIHIFVGQPSWLMVFLEYMTAQDPDQCGELVYNTLLELYLREDEDLDKADAPSVAVPGSTPSTTALAAPSTKLPKQSTETKRAKALQLLRDKKSKYSVDHALFLCQMHKFHQGSLFLYEHQGLHHEILNVHMRAHDHRAVIDTCINQRQPNLWKQVLQYFATEAEGDCTEEIEEVLAYIDKDNLLPPLTVVEILSRNPHVQLSVVKDYILRRLDQEYQEIRTDQEKIKSYQEETRRMRDEIRELRTSAKIFQNQKCADCTNPLKLPSCHFLCGHSFHQRCLSDERECSICAAQNSNVRKVKAEMDRSAKDHTGFLSRLEQSSDGFSTVAEYFGHGMFSAPLE
eukprot:c8652_g1_i2.p1 GENE.c8652_g1_i2~~c8652_g1_i2.p1  ORF type:complete len:738 (-),score=172.69 c8652_g1_i2:175-2388(-)